jgi:hypothetical protein
MKTVLIRHSRIHNNEFLCNMMLRYWLAFLRQSTPHRTRHNILLLAEEISHCPMASSRRDIVAHRAGVWPLAACSIMMRTLVTFSHDAMKQFRIVRSSKWQNILSCKGSNSCSVNYNIFSRRGQWTLANLLSQQNIGKKRSVKCYENTFICGHFHLCGANDQHVFTIQRFIVNSIKHIHIAVWIAKSISKQRLSKQVTTQTTIGETIGCIVT